MSQNNGQVIVVFLLLAAVSLIAFGRIAGNDFVDYDEIAYIIGNVHIQSGIHAESVKWAFTTTHFGYWHPLTWLSHMVDWSLFGGNASGHHLISLFLHLGSVVLLFLFFHKTTENIWASAFATAFFAVHPLRVESVAWAAERKDVLSMFFGMGSLYVYALYSNYSGLSRYCLCLVLFALSLMSKPLLVTMPFAFMLLDYWPLKRWPWVRNTQSIQTDVRSAWGLVLEKIPFLVLSFIFSAIVFLTQKNVGAMSTAEQLPLAERISNVIVSYAAYLGKIIWPTNFAVFYPYAFSIPQWKLILSGFFLILITAIVIYFYKKMPYLFVGWFWYLGAFVPLIGLVQVGEQSMADRHTYLPSIGIAMMLSWSVFYMVQSGKIRGRLAFSAGLAVIAVFAALTWIQCGYWKNSATLFGHAIQVTKENYVAHNNLAFYLNKKGMLKEAVFHASEAIRIKPKYELAYKNRGYAYAKMGDYKNAIRDLNISISLQPDDAEKFNFRGICYSETKKFKLAVGDYNTAIQLKPDYPDAYYNRANTYANKQVNQCTLAIKDYTEAIHLKPDYAEAWNNRGICYEHLGQYQQAIADYSEAIRIRPDKLDSLHNRAAAHLMIGNRQSGCRDANQLCASGICGLLESARLKGDCLSF